MGFRLLTSVGADTPATHTRSLRMSQRGRAWINPPTLARYVNHLQSFSLVESFTLSHFSLEMSDLHALRSLFCNLIPSVRKLRLHHVMACPRSLLRFISIFTDLQDTMIHAPHWTTSTHHKDTPALALTLRGELRLSRLEGNSCQFLDLLGSQAICFEKVILKDCGFMDSQPLQRLISRTGATLRQLDIVAVDDCKIAALSSICAFLKTRSSFRRSNEGPRTFSV